MRSPLYLTLHCHWDLMTTVKSSPLLMLVTSVFFLAPPLILASVYAVQFSKKMCLLRFWRMRCHFHLLTYTSLNLNV